MGPKIFLAQNFFNPKFLLDPKFSRTQIFGGTTIAEDQNSFRLFFGTHNFFRPKTFLKRFSKLNTFDLTLVLHRKQNYPFSDFKDMVTELAFGIIEFVGFS